MEDAKGVILVAEDNESNFDLLNVILRKEYCLVRAENGEEAVRLYKECKPDLILMDIKMPGMDGWEATRLIREISADIIIFAVSAYSYESDRIKSLEAVCNEFITKPIDIHLLKTLIKKYVFK